MDSIRVKEPEYTADCISGKSKGIMHSLDQEVLEKLTTWLRCGKRAWLCTTVATLGSSPRPVGSLFACNADGEIAGSLSGGCVEDDLVDRLRWRAGRAMRYSA